MNSPRAKRPASRSSFSNLLLTLLLGTLFAAPGLHAEKPASPKAKSKETHAEPKAVAADEDHVETSADAETLGEIAGYTKLATKAVDEDKWQLADHFLGLIVNLPGPITDKKKALTDIGALYEKKRSFSKAIAIYEKMISVYPGESDTPELIFKVALLYREAGAYQRSINRFYSVLNSALQANGKGIGTSRNLTQRAQTEIADTYFLEGDYAQAGKFYGLLGRLDLEPAEKARVLFKSAHCHFVLGHHDRAIVAAQTFLAEFPEDASAPEGRYILANAFRSQKRPKEAFAAVLTLLRAEQAKRTQAPEKWVFWQKKTGNEFANDFYQQGDFTSALTIYQTLAQLNDTPEWQWPVVYQMGLCFERLRLVDRAAEAYKFIIDESKKPERAGKSLPENCASLVKMATWRGEQLAWQHTTETQLSHLLGKPLAPPPATPAPANASAQNAPR
jgi:tetratricopeptide (TPR) repeat protein